MTLLLASVTLLASLAHRSLNVGREVVGPCNLLGSTVVGASGLDDHNIKQIYIDPEGSLVARTETSGVGDGVRSTIEVVRNGISHEQIILRDFLPHAYDVQWHALSANNREPFFMAVTVKYGAAAEGVRVLRLTSSGAQVLFEDFGDSIDIDHVESNFLMRVHRNTDSVDTPDIFTLQQGRVRCVNLESQAYFKLLREGYASLDIPKLQPLYALDIARNIYLSGDREEAREIASRLSAGGLDGSTRKLRTELIENKTSDKVLIGACTISKWPK